MTNKTEIPFEKLKRINDMHKKDTDSRMKDRVYAWIIDRYTKNSRIFEFSDRFIWSGSVYMIPEFIGYIIFFAIFYWLGDIIYDKYGFPHLFMFFMLLLIWRANIAIGYMKKLNSKLKHNGD